MKHYQYLLVTVLLFFSVFYSCDSMKFPEEIRITDDLSYNHDLDNNDNFSPDDQWLVYDVRTEEGGIGACPRIEKVNVKTGEKVVLYELEQNQDYGPGVGAVSYSHTDNKVVFIHGLLSITKENPYQQWRRTGVIIDDKAPGVPIFMDARDITFPFTEGALRGGTHRHEWSGDGQWIGFTYNDALMKQLEDSTGEIHNLRTIGVSHNIGPVEVDQDANGENISGEWFSALVVKVVPNPTPGSDEISRAAWDSWIGVDGYKKPDGSKQRARAFLGTVKNKHGEDVEEVFVVDIPEDITIAGDGGPLQGTRTEMPAVPKGAVQRRLTHTTDSPYPGCVDIVRSSADGGTLTFTAFDNKGVKQIFAISPNGGDVRQLTDHPTDVQVGARWNPDGTKICYVWDSSLFIYDFNKNESVRLTPKSEHSPSNHVWSHDGKTIAYNRLVPDENGALTKQIFTVNL